MKGYGEILFHCVICDRDIRNYNWRGPDEQIEPVCRSCERDYQPGTINKGAFRDRRKARQIGALAEALRCEAARAEWPAHWRDVNASA